MILLLLISRRTRNDVAKWMQKAITEPSLDLAINEWIDEYMYKPYGTITEPTCNKIKEVYADQNKIGWTNLFKGRLSKKIAQIQQQYYDQVNRRRCDEGKEALPAKYTGEWWTVNFIKRITYLALIHWQIRNEEAHRDKEKRKEETKRAELIREMGEWYEKSHNFKREHKKFFKVPIIIKSQLPNRNIEAWINTMRRLYNTYETDKKSIMNYMVVK